MRKGYIVISKEIYLNEWEEISVIFKDFRPNHIEFRHWENDLWYFYGTSSLFDYLYEGDVVPQYEVIFTRFPDGSLTYEFKRV